MPKKFSDIKKNIDIEKLIADRMAGLLKKNMELQHEVEEAKKAEAALQKGERGFRLLMEHTPDLLFINDSKGKIIDANRIACEALGYTREELLNLSISDIEGHITETS
jgi:PAS domain-containing protein